MEWYNILFYTVIGIFIIKTIFSWCVGEFDIDVDIDGDDDMDVSSLLSFKSVLHFLIGFSSVLYGEAHVSPESLPFTIGDYIFAVVTGFVFMGVLYFAYKLVMKADNYSKDPHDLIDNCYGIIYLNLGDNNYSVEAHTPAGTVNVNATSENSNLKVGDNVKLKVENNNIIII